MYEYTDEYKAILNIKGINSHHFMIIISKCASEHWDFNSLILRSADSNYSIKYIVSKCLLVINPHITK